jgi:AraC-like DNA-binding protein
MCLIDRAERYEISHGDGLRTLGIELPREILENELPDASRHAGIVMRGDSSGTRVLGGLLRTLGSELVGAGHESSLPPGLARSIAGFVAAAYADVPSGSGALRGLKSRLAAYRSYVDSRLAEGDLRPVDVARRFNVSERYVRMVFQSSGEPLSAYLLRRRHETAAALLTDKAYADHTVTEIALMCGFNSASHFGQSFREHYGQTPSQYRRSG